MNFESIPKLVLKRHVSVLMSLIAILVIGGMALIQIKLEFMPRGIESPFMGVFMPYPNSTPEEVEQLIAKKVEEALNTMPQRKRTTANINPNGCFVFIEFNNGADLDRGYMDLIDRMERLKPELPEDFFRYRVWRARENSGDDYNFFIMAENNNGDEYNFVKNFIVKKFERIDGVATVDFDAAGEKSIYVYLDNDKIKALKMNIAQIIQKLRQENFFMTNGFVYEGGQKLFVRSRSKMNNLEELRQLQIDSKGIKLKDIAEINYDVGENKFLWHVNSQPGMEIEISKEPLANTIDVTDQIDAVLNELNEHPQVKAMGLKLLPIFNKGTYIKQSVNNLIQSGLWGGLFALTIIYLFIRRFRMTMIITMAIPMSVFISIMCLYFMDLTLNGMTMMGLLIAVGLVVDNAIVITENIYQKRRQGLSIEASAIKGSSEVGLAITMSTLTTIAIFAPILFMPNSGMNAYFKAIAIPVVAALGASLIVAIIYIPYTSTRLTSSKEVVDRAWAIKIAELFAKIALYSINKRRDAMIVFLILMLYLIFAPGSNSVAMRGGNVNDVRLMIDMPSNYTWNQTQNFIKIIEDSVQAHTQKYNVKAYSVFGRNTFVRANIFLNKEETPQWYESVYRNIRKGLSYLGLPDISRPMSREEVEAAIKKSLPEIPGMKLRTSWREQGFMKTEPSLSLEVEGDDIRKLLEISEEMERRFKQLDYVIGVEVDVEQGQDEIQVTLDRDKVKKFNLDVSVVRSFIDYNIRGIRLNNFQNEKGEEETVVVQSRRADRERLEQLANLTIINADSKPIMLSSIANFQVKKGLGTIRHINGKTVVQLKVKTKTDDESMKLSANLNSILAGLNMPFGYQFGLGQIERQQSEDDDDTLLNIVMGVILVFFLMGILFESFILPLSVIVSVPLAFIGSKIMMVITNTPLDIMANIGYIILVGIVVNNGIVLIDSIIRHRKEGMLREEAIQMAAKERTRPILMTALTTIAGLLPMALGETEFVGIKYAPMGMVVVGGLFMSTLLTMVYTPVFYTFFDDIRLKLIKLVSLAFIKNTLTANDHISEIEN